jgi:hypothetical protein
MDDSESSGSVYSVTQCDAEDLRKNGFKNGPNQKGRLQIDRNVRIEVVKLSTDVILASFCNIWHFSSKSFLIGSTVFL